jgi:hypothetical protein
MLKRILFAFALLIAGLGQPVAQAAPVTNVSVTNAITAFTRTSASGVTPMTWSLTLGSSVHEGYTLHARVYSDSGLVTLVQDVAHVLTGPDMVAGATIDLTSDGLIAPTATQWLQLSIEATSPHGAFYSYTYGTALSPTDAAVAMTLSASDKTAGIGLSNGNLFAAQGGAPGGARASRGVSSGKFYVEFVAATARSIFTTAARPSRSIRNLRPAAAPLPPTRRSIRAITGRPITTRRT